MTEQALKQQKEFDKTTLGFWLYLMTDCVLFASLFATFAVLRGGTAGGPGGAELFDLNFVLIETLILLTSSLTSGLVLVGLREKSKSLVWLMLVSTFALGATFLFMELYEFGELIRDGYGPQASAFLSSYFTLVGVHGAHILVGLVWICVLGVLLYKRGLSYGYAKRLTMFSMFWHFLDIVWIFIFTIVYLAGVIV